MARDTIRFLRMIVGIAIGMAFLHFDHQPLDAVVAAAFVPGFIHAFTEEFER